MIFGKKEKQNTAAWIIAAVIVTALAFVLALRWDYWFDLNDDVLMKDILIGAYTGTPESRNIQMLWPISALISLFCRITNRFDWYGLFLVVCQFGALGVILGRFLTLGFKRRSKIIGCIGIVIFYLEMMLMHLLIVQYTLTVAMLSSAAAFWLITMEFPSDEQMKKPAIFLKAMCREVWPVFVLIWIAFPVRSEMTLLMLPLVATGMVLRFAIDGKLFTKKNVCSALVVGCILLAGMGVEYTADVLACSSPEWKEFRSFFNARTELYDFYFEEIPDYESNSEFYDSIGVSKESADLLINYNFGLDDKIDAQLLWKISGQAAKNKAAKTTPAKLFRTALYNYKERFKSEEDMPYVAMNGCVLILIFAVLLLTGDKRRILYGVFGLVFLFVIRTGLWMYILYRGRAPERITHSLYLMEFLLLAGMFLMCCRQSKSGRGRRGLIYSSLLIIVAVLLLPVQIKKLSENEEYRNGVNVAEQEYLDYCAAHPDNFYFTDVYSTVRYSQKMFGGFHAGTNYDLMGGWACKSPLYQKKIAAYGFTSMMDAIAYSDNCYFVSAQDRDPSWLVQFYASKGIKLQLEEYDTIGNSWVVYRTREGE